MKYYIKQKVFSLKDKFLIKDYSQNDLYQVEGKFMSLSNKLKLMNMDGSQILHSKRVLFRFLPLYHVYSNHDEEMATIQRKFSFKPKFEVTIGTREYVVEGTLFAHSVIASIEKKVFSFGDSYEIDILDENQKELFLFVVIIIDQVIHEQQRKRHG